MGGKKVTREEFEQLKQKASQNFILAAEIQEKFEKEISGLKDQVKTNSRKIEAINKKKAKPASKAKKSTAKKRSKRPPKGRK